VEIEFAVVGKDKFHLIEKAAVLLPDENKD
jgi:hypothetical protein